jgi:hypothetical protein
VTSIQQISIDGCSDVNLEDIKMRQIVSLDGNCASSNKVDTDISNNMDAAMQQQAESVSQAFQLTSAEAENITNITQNLSTAVSTSFNQQCATVLDNTQNIACSNSTGVFIKKVDFDQNIQATVACIQANEAVTKLTNELSTAVSQTASAKTEGLFSWLSNLIMLIIVGCVGLVVLKFVFQKKSGGGGGAPKVPTIPYTTSEVVGISIPATVLAISTALTAGFLVTTFAKTTIWPYTRKISNKPTPKGEELSEGAKQANASNDKRNKSNANTNVIIFVIALALDVATIVLIYYFYNRHKTRALGPQAFLGNVAPTPNVKKPKSGKVKKPKAGAVVPVLTSTVVTADAAQAAAQAQAANATATAQAQAQAQAQAAAAAAAQTAQAQAQAQAAQTAQAQAQAAQTAQAQAAQAQAAEFQRASVLYAKGG